MGKRFSHHNGKIFRVRWDDHDIGVLKQPFLRLRKHLAHHFYILLQSQLCYLLLQMRNISWITPTGNRQVPLRLAIDFHQATGSE